MIPNKNNNDNYSKQKKKKTVPVGNIRGFSDFNNDNNNSDDDNDFNNNDDDERNEYFTGGERSGMMVQDPNKIRRSNNNNRGIESVGGLFEQALAAGADMGRPEDLMRTNNNNNNSNGSRMPFSGTSHVLGDNDTKNIDDNNGNGTNDDNDDNGPIVHTITFYRNGFTVNNNNTLRSMSDPNNASFLQSIAKGECPKELEHNHNNGTISNAMRPVHVNLVRRDEDYVEPEKPKYVAFSGSGRTLGSTSNDNNDNTTNSSKNINENCGSGSNNNSGGLVVDESLPTTSVQIRLSDGTRMIARFNQEIHTVGDIRNFIIR